MSPQRTVAIPCESSDGLDALRSAHVGRAPFFVLVRIAEDGSLGPARIERNPADESSGHGVVAAMLVGEAVTDLVVEGIGEGMRTRLVPAGVRIWRDTRSETAGDAARALAAGVLAPLAEADVHPGHHGRHGPPPVGLN